MSDISLLPEDMRAKEAEEAKKQPQKKSEEAEVLRMHIPEEEAEENIEIIEVDESDLAAVLSDEPFMTRLTYQLGVAIDKLKAKLTTQPEAAPPPKLPPQFFKPPKPGMVTKPGEAATPAPPVGKPGIRIEPLAEAPKRVRVIKRVRKPVQVSLISSDQLASLRVNVSKRKWTMSVVSLVFATIILGGYFLLTMQIAESESRLAGVEEQLTETRGLINERLERWQDFEDLQPRLTLLDDILNNHVVISRLLQFLEQRTLPSVVYRTATMNEDGQLTLDVIANSYDAAAEQLVAFEQSDIVKSVDATVFNSRTESGENDEEIFTVTFQLVLGIDMKRLRGPLLVQEEPAVVSEALESIRSR